MSIPPVTHCLESVARFEGEPVAQDPHGRFVAVCGGDKATIIDTTTFRPKAVRRITLDPDASVLAVSPDGAAVLCRDGRELKRYPTTGAAQRVSAALGAWFTADGRHVMVAHVVKDKLLALLFDAELREHLAELPVLGLTYPRREVVPIGGELYALADDLRSDPSDPDTVMGFLNNGDSLAVTFGFRAEGDQLVNIDPKTLGLVLDPCGHHAIWRLRRAHGAVVVINDEFSLFRHPWPPRDTPEEDVGLTTVAIEIEEMLAEGAVDVPFSPPEGENIYVFDVLSDDRAFLGKIETESEVLALILLNAVPLAVRGIVPIPPAHDEEPEWWSLCSTSLVARFDERETTFFRLVAKGETR
jgi:hypothetical protein